MAFDFALENLVASGLILVVLEEFDSCQEEGPFDFDLVHWVLVASGSDLMGLDLILEEFVAFG